VCLYEIYTTVTLAFIGINMFEAQHCSGTHRYTGVFRLAELCVAGSVARVAVHSVSNLLPVPEVITTQVRFLCTLASLSGLESSLGSQTTKFNSKSLSR